MNLFKKILVILLPLSVFLLALLGAEVFFRIYDGYSLTHLYIDPIAPSKKRFQQYNIQKDPLLNVAKPYLNNLPIAQGVNRSWFLLDPPPLTDPKNIFTQELKKLWLQLPTGTIGNVYNLNYVYQYVCKKPMDTDSIQYNMPALLSSLRSIFVFIPQDTSVYPRYRWVPNVTLPSSGMVVNNFGFRGPSLSLKKNSRVIRIAFVGASTTVNYPTYPHSYPELVTYWLNKWAKENHYPIVFEGINAARSGLSSSDLVALVDREVMPLKPDVIIYYEGSNQFWPDKYINFSPSVRVIRGAAPVKLAIWSQHLDILHHFSTLWFLITHHSGKEPRKPSYRMEWPATLNEFEPEVYDQSLPVNLPTIMSDWDKIREVAQKNHTLFIPSSFVWLSYAGLELRLPAKREIYEYLNKLYWPFSYAWIRRMADFQNRVFYQYAQKNHLAFIDVAKFFPQDSEFFMDGIHMQYMGVRLKAWIVFSQLLPVIKSQIDRHLLPAVSQNLGENNYQLEKIKLLTLSEIQELCRKRIIDYSLPNSMKMPFFDWGKVVQFKGMYVPITQRAGWRNRVHDFHQAWIDHGKIIHYQDGHYIIQGKPEGSFSYLLNFPSRVISSEDLKHYDYYLVARGKLQAGGFALGVVLNNQWKEVAQVDSLNEFRIYIKITEPGNYLPVLANNSPTLANADFSIDTIGWLMLEK